MESAIGFSTMLAIGPRNYRAMLQGMHEMDEHFRLSSIDRNLPVIMGLIGVWNTNFLGAKAIAQFPEQVGHAQLFSVDRRKDTIVCISMEGDDKTMKLARLLQRKGFRVRTITGHSKNIVTRSVEVSFYLQHLTLTLAKRRGMEECAFLADESRLQLSDRLIYH